MDQALFQSYMTKFADQASYPRMIGTGGGLDYLIIARRPEVNLQLGVKALIQVGGSASQVGFRLRSAPIPANQGGVGSGQIIPLMSQISAANGVKPEPTGETVTVTQGYPSTGWPFPWEKVSEERASLVRTFTFKRGADQIAHLFEDLQTHRFYGKLMAFLLEKAPAEQWQVTPDDLTEFMKAMMFQPVQGLMEQTDPNSPFAKLHKVSANAKASLKGEPEPSTYVPAEADEDFSSGGGVSGQMLQGLKPGMTFTSEAPASDDLKSEAAAAIAALEGITPGSSSSDDDDEDEMDFDFQNGEED